jgi:hypothetical protein
MPRIAAQKLVGPIALQVQSKFCTPCQALFSPRLRDRQKKPPPLPEAALLIEDR